LKFFGVKVGFFKQGLSQLSISSIATQIFLFSRLEVLPALLIGNFPMTSTLLKPAPTKNAMFLPHHEQCTAININPKEPIAQDRLLNSLFPAETASKFDWDWSTSAGESEIAENINSYLDVLSDVFSEHSSHSGALRL
jgi:hypothetical protein